jgi:Glycosyl transferase family 2
VRIVAVTRLLNEEDIVEPQVRHHAALVDHHVILDNGSSDRTLEILDGLLCEGIPLTILQNDSSIFSEVQSNTLLYNAAAGEHGADWVVFLDADEFIDARRIPDLRSFLAAVPAGRASVGLEMVNYDAPSPVTDREINVVKRFSRRSPEPMGVWKVAVRGGLGLGRVAVVAGNHGILLDGHQVESLRQHDVVLAHYPHRSPFQFAAKAVTGRLKVLAAGQAELRHNRNHHYNQPFDALKQDPRAWVRAADERFDRLKTTTELVDDPIAYLGGELIYTEPVDYGWRALGLTLRTIEKMATQYGAVLDRFAEARAQVEAEIGEARVISRHRSADAPRAAYGAIVTEAWRSAAAANFATLLGAGWSKPEDWGGIWGVGPAHEMRLYYGAAPPNAAEIEADVAAALIGSRDRQAVDVIVLGQALATWTFVRGNNRGLRTARIPASLIAASLPIVTVEFRPHSVASPAALDPARKDTRLLGMGIRGLRQRLS